jgi:hypothetical protein
MKEDELQLKLDIAESRKAEALKAIEPLSYEIGTLKKLIAEKENVEFEVDNGICYDLRGYKNGTDCGALQIKQLTNADEAIREISIARDAIPILAEKMLVWHSNLPPKK